MPGPAYTCHSPAGSLASNPPNPSAVMYFLSPRSAAFTNTSLAFATGVLRSGVSTSPYTFAPLALAFDVLSALKR